MNVYVISCSMGTHDLLDISVLILEPLNIKCTEYNFKFYTTSINNQL